MKQNKIKQPAPGLGILLFCVAIMLSGSALSAAGEKATVDQLNAVVTNQATIDAGQNAAISTINSKISDITPSVRAIGDILSDNSIVFWVDETGQRGLAAQPFDDNPGSWYSSNERAENHGPGWRLPTKHELNLLYLQKDVVGGFAIPSYWSSTEAAADYAWLQLFGNGAQLSYDKEFTTYVGVRAVRAF